jgi:hypothetical protein
MEKKSLLKRKRWLSVHWDWFLGIATPRPKEISSSVKNCHFVLGRKWCFLIGSRNIPFQPPKMTGIIGRFLSNFPFPHSVKKYNHFQTDRFFWSRFLFYIFMYLFSFFAFSFKSLKMFQNFKLSLFWSRFLDFISLVPAGVERPKFRTKERACKKSNSMVVGRATRVPKDILLHQKETPIWIDGKYQI